MATRVYNGVALAPSTVYSTQVNRSPKGIRLFLDITAETGAGTLDVKVQVYDTIGDDWYDLPGAAFAQKSGVGQSMLTVHPEVAAVANVAVAQYVGSPWRCEITEAGGGSTMTFTLSFVELDK